MSNQNDSYIEMLALQHHFERFARLSLRQVSMIMKQRKIYRAASAATELEFYL